MKDEQAISSSRFCWFTVLSALALMTGIALFNAVVDPFGMYRLVDAVGFNHLKPDSYNRVRLLKAFEVRRIRPQAIVLGTSRSHIALRPSHPDWRFKPVYNLAFDAATPKEMYFYLLHADAVRRLKQVVVGLDTYQLNHDLATVNGDFDPDLLYKPQPQVEWPRLLTADLRLLTGLATLRASVDTLRRQREDEKVWLAADGQRLGDVYFRQADETFVNAGPRAYFDLSDRQKVGYALGDASDDPSADPGKNKTAAGDAESSIGYIRRIVDYCRRRHIDLRLYITPAHAHDMELSARLEGWRTLENGKRDLVNLLALDAAAHPGEAPIPLFDFSGYSAITTESLPPPGSRSEMKYYWDESHFKQGIGDRILDSVLGWPNGSPAPDEDFGIRLTPQTIEGALARTRARQAIYRKTHPADIAELERIIRLGKKAVAAAEE